MATVGEKMKAAREGLGLSLRDVGNALGVVRQQVQNWEAGRFRPGPKHLTNIAKVLKMQLPDLISDEI